MKKTQPDLIAIKKKHISVLLVEDDETHAMYIKDLLSKEKYVHFDVVVVDTLQKALASLTSVIVDIVLLDLSLPDCSATETFSAVYEKFPAMPIVVLTSYMDDVYAVEIVSEGAQDYLFKYEVTKNLISRSIQYAIERKKLLNELHDALEKVKTLKGLIPVCAWCKKIRDDKGYWNLVEDYLKKSAHVDVSHGICPECSKKVKEERNEKRK